MSTTFRGTEEGISRDKSPTFSEGDMNAEGDAREKPPNFGWGRTCHFYPLNETYIPNQTAVVPI